MIFFALKKVFCNIRYVGLAGIIAFAVFVFSVWLPNFKLIKQIIISPAVGVQDKFSILSGLLGSIKTNFTLFSASYTIIIAVLFGINVAMFVYFTKKRKKFLQKSGVSLSAGGLVSGMFGIGCAACGTFILWPLLSLIGAGAVITFLPFGGQEFGVIAVAFLSLYF